MSRTGAPSPALPPALRTALQLSAYGDLGAYFRQANLAAAKVGTAHTCSAPQAGPQAGLAHV
jgi:hypothetical protein